ncbi:efflux transporter, RND family, MFP subunit [Chthoniobacter flavus Ellin428]|uniref:Efflux transporter, RND family, MFP subunit n=1 Tax=Chthoniobacter flavus Ellin428 TaxID=497964 RepID=B4CZ50_9BACT|nr:efflux RND transporter periplasmic adaptor subunit [Chthoniobacter flavus]EDY20741.1 efflux transporter, RND family, MFP subunit [Chthoniobacter flavus Ellin428]
MANYIELEPTPAKPRPNLQQPEPKKGGWLIWVILLALVLGGIWFYTHRPASTATTGSGGKGRGAGGPVPVVVGAVTKKDVPIYLEGIGTIQALNTVTVRTRVDGQLEKVAFEEGQDVKAGDVLAIIDQAPYKAAVEQAQAKLKQDQAQLNNAKLDYDRYADLVAKKVISSQQYDTQKALVAQFEGTVANDTAAVESAKVNLNYTTIVSPLDGRTGIRLVDQGNIVHAADTTGLVVITQLHPISLIFTLPEQSLTAIHKETADGKELAVLAMDRDDKTKLDTGKLSVIDNQIDITTGTIKLKATFENKDLMLWPGEFINAHLHLSTQKDGLVVPASVIQHGPNGTYVFVVQDDQTVQIREVKVTRKENGDMAQTEDGEALIESGLAEGEKVVVDGQYKLQNGFQDRRLPRRRSWPGGRARGRHQARQPRTERAQEEQ